jgi:hypothetical protein
MNTDAALSRKMPNNRVNRSARSEFRMVLSVPFARPVTRGVGRLNTIFVQYECGFTYCGI